MLSIWITTAPRSNYIQESINSLRDCWIKQKINIFAEPWSLKPTDSNMIYYEHPYKLWLFMNWNFVVNTLKWDHILILQDDFIYSKNLKKELNKILKIKKDYWFYCIYTSQILVDKNFIYKEWRNEIKTWWDWSWGAMYIFKRKVLDRILNHQFYQNHKKRVSLWVKPNRQVDAVIWECCKLMWLDCYYHNPSLAKHIGEISTRWIKDCYINNWFTYKKF